MVSLCRSEASLVALWITVRCTLVYSHILPCNTCTKFSELLPGLSTNLPLAASVWRCGDMRRQLAGQDVTVLWETGTWPWLGPAANQGQQLVCLAWLLSTWVWLGMDHLPSTSDWIKQSVYFVYPSEWNLFGYLKRSYSVKLKMFTPGSLILNSSLIFCWWVICVHERSNAWLL